jgi:hypothetical protein
MDPDIGSMLMVDPFTIGAITALFGATNVRDFFSGSVVCVELTRVSVVTSDAAPRMIGIY